MRLLIRSLFLAAMMAAPLPLIACGDSGDAGRTEAQRSISFDGPTYESIGELSAAADIVAIGRARVIHSRVTEADLHDVPKLDGGKGLPLALYEVNLTKTFKGPATRTVLITRIDTDRVRTTDQTMFPLGIDLMLFLRDTDLTTDGMKIFSVVGMDQGWLRIANGKLRAVSTVNDHAGPGDGQAIEDVTALIR